MGRPSKSSQHQKGTGYRRYPQKSVPIGLLKQFPENPRVPITEDPDFYKKLDGSMEAFGYVVPIVWNERTGHVVSGSTLIACERTDRSCYMIELEPHYCDIIVRRWEDHTGEKAQRPS